MVSFAGGGTDSRTTQLFVTLRDSKFLGKANWETPIAQVVEGMDVVDAWYKGCAYSCDDPRVNLLPSMCCQDTQKVWLEVFHPAMHKRECTLTSIKYGFG